MPPATLPIIFITSFGVGFSGAITPGPLLVFNIRESIRQGFFAGPLVALGHALLELLVVAGLALGVARFLEESLASFVIAVLGGLFLLWMGWGMVKRPTSHVLPDRIQGSANASGGRISTTVIGGAVVSISNPFWSLWWATIGLGYIVWAAGLGFGGIVSFYTGHILSDLVWYSVVAFAIASGRRIMTPRMYQTLIVTCGTFLLALGGYFLYAGVGFMNEFLGT